MSRGAAVLQEQIEAVVGPVSVEATPRGVSRIRLGAPSAFVLGDTPEAVEVASRALDQLYEYFAGERRTFDLPLDLEGATLFRRRVLEALLEVPFGEALTYGELARVVGSRSARAVGQAVGWNPLPIVIPCHRVLAAGGGLGGYSAGLGRKRHLLALEGIRVGSAWRRAGSWTSTSPPRTPSRPG